MAKVFRSRLYERRKLAQDVIVEGGELWARKVSRSDLVNCRVGRTVSTDAACSTWPSRLMFSSVTDSVPSTTSIECVASARMFFWTSTAKS